MAEDFSSQGTPLDLSSGGTPLEEKSMLKQAGAESRFNTSLTPQEEQQYAPWKAQYAPQDSGEDYDLRGAFKAGLTPDAKTGHWPDTFKKPNHPTFSNESLYAAQGNPGHWEGDKFIPPMKTAPGRTGSSQGTPLDLSSGGTPLEEKSKLKQVGAEVASAADVIANTPAWAVSVLGRATTYPIEAARGAMGAVKPGEAPTAMGRAEEKVNKLTEPINNMFSKAYSTATGGGTDTTQADKVMSKLTQPISWLAEKGAKVGVDPAMTRWAGDVFIGLLGDTVVKGASGLGKTLGERVSPADMKAEQAKRSGFGYGDKEVTPDSVNDIMNQVKQGATKKPIPDSAQADLPFSSSVEEAAAHQNAKTKQRDLFIDEAAFKNKQTGEVTKSGNKHDVNKKKSSKLEQGFVDKSGTFLDRKEAEDRVRETGQIPKDAELSRPEEGLHSGDVFRDEYKLAVGNEVNTNGGKGTITAINKDGSFDVKHPDGNESVYTKRDLQKPDLPPELQGEQKAHTFDPIEAAKQSYKLGETLVDKAKEIYEKHGEEAARVFVQAYQDEQKGQTKATTSPSIRIKTLSDDLYSLRGERTADTIEAQQKYKAMPETAKSEEAYHAMPSEANAGQVPLPKELQDLQKEAESAYREASAVAGEPLPEELDPHNTRVADRSALDRVKEFSSGVMGGGSFSRKAGTMRARSMIAIEHPDGTRQVVNRDGNRLHGFDENQNLIPEPMYKGTLKEADIKVGKTLPDGAKVVEATTKEVEAQTKVRYQKDAAANTLNAINQLKAYTRETSFLKQLMPSLEKDGMAVAKADVSSPPKGFRAVQGHPTLEKYYFNSRYASVFEDSILHGGPEGGIVRGLEIANSASVGTLFWNPYPHLQNTFDHFINTMGFDIINPLNWPGMGKAIYEAFKDVSDVSPEYLKYIREGWGLQYGNVVAEKGMKNVLQSMPEADIKGIAKAWGMKPLDFVNSVYGLSKGLLWGGGDVLMISARKYLASKQGIDVFNKALGNYVEAHNPNYRIPANVGFDTLMKIPGMQEAIATSISRVASKAMQSRAFNTFGRYHYGQIKDVSSNIHDLVTQNEHSTGSRGQALSHLAFTVFSLGVIYPYIWDNIARTVTGDENATQRRAGASTIPYTVWKIALGDESVTKLLAEWYNLPPVTKSLIEVPNNRDLFSGKHIWEPGDSLPGKVYDTTKHVGQMVLPPAKTVANLAGNNPTKEIDNILGMKTTDTRSEIAKGRLSKQDTIKARRRQRDRGW